MSFLWGQSESYNCLLTIQRDDSSSVSAGQWGNNWLSVEALPYGRNYQSLKGFHEHDKSLDESKQCLCSEKCQHSNDCCAYLSETIERINSILSPTVSASHYSFDVFVTDTYMKQAYDGLMRYHDQSECLGRNEQMLAKKVGSTYRISITLSSDSRASMDRCRAVVPADPLTFAELALCTLPLLECGCEGHCVNLDTGCMVVERVEHNYELLFLDGVCLSFSMRSSDGECMFLHLSLEILDEDVSSVHQRIEPLVC